MSESAVQEFLKSATNNPVIFEKVAASVAGQSQAEAGEAVAALGAQEGFIFTGAEALAVRDRIVASVRAAREDVMLQGVHGGSGSNTVSQDQLNGMQSGLGLGTSAVMSTTGVPGVVGTVIVAATVATVDSAANGTSWDEAFSNAVINGMTSTANTIDSAVDTVTSWFSSW